MIDEFAFAQPTPRVAGLRRSLSVAVLLVGAASLTVACSSDDTPEAEASSTEVVADEAGQPGPAGAPTTIGDLEVTNARIGEPAGATAGLYLSVTNSGDEPDTLSAIATDVAPEVQLHETTSDGGRTSMQELASGVEVPACETVDLEPGGLHAMLLKVDELEVDQQVPVTLSFEHAGEVDLDVPVVPLTDLGSEHSNTDHSDTDHSDTDHSDTDHSDTDHSDTDHSDTDHSDTDHSDTDHSGH